MMASDASQIGQPVKSELALTTGVQPKIIQAKEEHEIIEHAPNSSTTSNSDGQISFTTKKPRVKGRQRRPKSEETFEKPKKRPKKAVKPEIAPILTDTEKAAMKRKANLIEAKLIEVFPNPPDTFLDHTDAFTLLVAVVLSAQCLDATVNSVTPALFAEAPTPEAMVKLGIPRIKELITKIGLNNSKSRYLYGLSQALVEQHNGEVPASLEEMEKLPGVGHKTASVVASHYFNIPAFPVDTHIHRLACRWGIGHPKSVPITEMKLKQWFDDPNTWLDLHKRLILFGRVHCKATRHDMDECPICSFAATTESRAMNRKSAGKFLGAASHKNPYSIRGIDADDPVEMGQARPDHDNSSPENANLQPELPENSQSTASATRQPVISPSANIAMTGAKSKSKPSTPRVKSPRTITKSPSSKSKSKSPAKAQASTKKNTKTPAVVDETGLRRSSRIRERKNKE